MRSVLARSSEHPTTTSTPILEGRAMRLAENIPLGRPGTPDDIAPWIVFMSTPEAAYATGATFVIDGGLTVS